jgi:hypothetical protein
VGARRFAAKKRREDKFKSGLLHKRGVPVSGGLAEEIARLAKLPQVLKRRKSARIEYPSAFSFIEDPDPTILALNQTIQAIRARPKDIQFDQSACVQLDLCAASVLNALVRDARKRYSVRCRGVLPRDRAAAEIAEATGLKKELQIEANRTLGARYLHFPLSEGYANRIHKGVSSDKNLHATRITQYINDCFKTVGFVLTESGNGHLSAMTSEVIDNAETHSLSRRWWVAGYLRQSDRNQIGDCHLVIFNTGRTISQSLQTLPSSSRLRGKIEKLVSLHRNSGFLGFGPDWTEENLWTLYALQQGVSAKNVASGLAPAKDDGQGTVDLIRWFLALGRRKDGMAEPRMAITSGSTHILFDGTHELFIKRIDENMTQKQITFNRQRSLDFPPEKKYVRTIKEFFPGTVISLRFFFDKNFLAEKTHGKR